MAPIPSFGIAYDEVDLDDVPVPPIDFPTPRIRQVHSMSAPVCDHHTGQTSDKIVFVSIPQGRPGNAYAVQKTLRGSTATTAQVYLTNVLRRVSIPNPDDEDEVCVWETTDQLAVVKASTLRRISRRQLADPLNEAAALQHLGNYHPNIVGCIEILRDDENVYVVAPYCDGGDLHDVTVRNGRNITENHARFWFRQLLNGLSHLQKKGVCHRSLSLENLVADNEGNLKMVGFSKCLRVPYTDARNIGSVSDVSEGSKRRLIRSVGRVASNEMYLAPEIVAQQPFDGFAVDLWAAGIILFIWLVGSAPFPKADPSDFRFARIGGGHLREVLQGLDILLSDTACDLLQWMLHSDPKRRPTLSQILHHPWVTGIVASNPRGCLASPTKSVTYYAAGGELAFQRPCPAARSLSAGLYGA